MFFQGTDSWWFDYFVAWKFGLIYYVKLFKTPNDTMRTQIIIVKSHEKKMTNTIHCLVSITTPGQFLKQQEFGFLHNFSIILKRAREKKTRRINYKIVFIPSCKSKVTVFQRRCRRIFVNLHFFLPYRRMH